ncbi:hypothetical protein QJQ45_001852 [Haematococcus lacustris]|nr:hypothetical protein QJQ45_001852 [Haematococcus lacustris]
MDRAFPRCNRAITRVRGLDTQLSGCTSCVALLTPQGKVEPCGQGVTAWEFTNDHTPASPAEAARVQACGGCVAKYNVNGQAVGPLRVWCKDRDAPGLCITRSFGDALAHSIGVTEEPEVVTHSLEQSDRYLLIISNSICEYMENQEVMEYVHAQASQGLPPEAVGKSLCQETQRRWRQHEQGLVAECTVAVVYLHQQSAEPVPEDPDSDIEDRDEALQPDLTEAQQNRKVSGEARAARDRDNTYHGRKCKIAHLIDHLPQELWDAFLADAVRPRAEAISERGVLASLLLGLLVRGLFTIRVADPLGLHDQPVYTDIPVSQAAIPDLSCRNLFLQLVRGPPGNGANTQPNAAVAAVLAEHPDLRARLAAIPRHLSDTNMVDHVGKQLETAFSNMLTLLFAGRLKKSVSLAGAKVLLGTEEHRRRFGFWGVGGGHLPAWSKRACTYVRRMVCGLDVSWLLEQGGVVPTPAMHDVHDVKKQAQKRWPDRILALAYGAASFSGSGSIGCRGVPVSQMRKEAVKQFGAGRVVLVDEFRTSRVSSAYSHPIEALPGQPPESFRWLRPVYSEAKRSQVRGLMSLTSYNIRFYDRDVSAALNIRRCAVGPGPRPTELCYWDGRPAMPKPGRPGQEWVYLRDKALLPRQAQATASSPGSSRAAAARVAAKLAELKKEKSDTNARCRLTEKPHQQALMSLIQAEYMARRAGMGVGPGPETAAETEAAAEARTAAVAGTETATETEPAAGKEPTAEAGTGARAGTEAEAGTGTGAGAGIEAETGAGTEPAAEAGTGAGAEAMAGAGAGKRETDMSCSDNPLPHPPSKLGPALIGRDSSPQLRAHTRYNLSQADRQGRDRARDEAWEARRDDDREEGSARPWTRIALLDSDSALNSVSFASDARTVARQRRDTDHATAIFGAAQPGIASRPSPPAASAPRPHTSPSPPSSVHPSSQTSSHHPHPAALAMAKSSEELGAGAVGGRVWGTGLAACLDEEGPVVVEEGGCGLISWAEKVEPQGLGAALQGGGAGMLGLAVNSTGKQEVEEWVGGAALARMPGLGQSRGQGPVLLAGEMEARPAEQSWRDRARQARAAKLAAEEQEAAKAVGAGPGVPAGSSSAEAGLGEEGGGGGEPLQPAEARAPLALTWRDRAKARARPSLPGTMSAGV